MNLFKSTRKLAKSAQEDHMTEFFAAALEVSPKFSQAYYNLVISSYAKKMKWEPATIVGITTQYDFKDTSCRPDMILTLSNGKVIACEHKLDAEETLGKAVVCEKKLDAGATIGDTDDGSEEKKEVKQLERYLKLPIDGLVYVRSSWKRIKNEVLDNEKYVKPVRCDHYMWRDFYPLLEASDDHVLVKWLREGFKSVGFTPPHPSIGEMAGREKEVNISNRKNFTKFWDRTRSCARKLGWKVSSGSIVELYLSGNSSSIASDIFISPAKSGSDRFLFRVTPRKEEMEKAEKLLEATISKLGGRPELVKHIVKRKEGKLTVIDITTTLTNILGAGELQSDEIENQLLEFTRPLLLALQNESHEE